MDVLPKRRLCGIETSAMADLSGIDEDKRTCDFIYGPVRIVFLPLRSDLLEIHQLDRRTLAKTRNQQAGSFFFEVHI